MNGQLGALKVIVASSKVRWPACTTRDDVPRASMVRGSRPDGANEQWQWPSFSFGPAEV